MIIGSRLFPRSNWLNDTLLNVTFDAYKTPSDLGLLTINFNIAPTLEAGGNLNNAVNPGKLFLKRSNSSYVLAGFMISVPISDPRGIFEVLKLTNPS